MVRRERERLSEALNGQLCIALDSPVVTDLVEHCEGLGVLSRKRTNDSNNSCMVHVGWEDMRYMY